LATVARLLLTRPLSGLDKIVVTLYFLQSHSIYNASQRTINGICVSRRNRVHTLPWFEIQFNGPIRFYLVISEGHHSTVPRDFVGCTTFEDAAGVKGNNRRCSSRHISRAFSTIHGRMRQASRDTIRLNGNQKPNPVPLEDPHVHPYCILCTTCGLFLAFCPGTVLTGHDSLPGQYRFICSAPDGNSEEK